MFLFQMSQISKRFSNMFIKKKPCASWPTQFKPVLLKDQLCMLYHVEGAKEKNKAGKRDRKALKFFVFFFGSIAREGSLRKNIKEFEGVSHVTYQGE